MAAEPLFQSPLRVGLAGAGRVGTAVAALLAKNGHRITGVWSRSPSSGERASVRLGAPIASSARDAAEGADVILVGVADEAVPEVAREVAAGARAGAVVIHFAGALGAGAIDVAGGAHAAALHPVQSIPDVDVGLERLPGSAWGVTCSPEVEGWAQRFVRDALSGVPVVVGEDDRVLWHAAAVMTSNAIAALMSTGASVLEGIGVADPRGVLGPLAAGTVANVLAMTRPGDAFTGPVVRGDGTTIERHLDELRRRAPDLVEEYRLAARIVVSGASRTSRIDEATRRSMSDLLESA